MLRDALPLARRLVLGLASSSRNRSPAPTVLDHPVGISMPVAALPAQTRFETATLPAGEIVAELQRWFGLDFSIWSVQSGNPVFGTAREAEEICRSTRVLETIWMDGQAVILGETQGVAILAIPIPDESVPAWVAVAPVATASSIPANCLIEAASLLGITLAQATTWCASREQHSLDSVRRLAAAYLRTKDADHRIRQAEERLQKTVERLTSSYEEVSLLHRLTQRLSYAQDEAEVGQLAIQWILNYLPARGCALHLAGSNPVKVRGYCAPRAPELLVAGAIPFELEDIVPFLQTLDFSYASGAYLYNAPPRLAVTPLPHVRQLAVAQIADRRHVFGHLILVNHDSQRPFGSSDSTLIKSVASVLGVHFGHCELTRQQAEFLAGVVRVLSSAIDAKDSYTCGHSDRVAQISVVLARDLGCDEQELHTIYMAGLLHDIGKIGVDDAVLRKPDRLTEDEFAQVRLHPDLGVGILSDLEHLQDLLPVVRHHHEQWNGKGYPSGLAGSEIPLAARIVAVADAYDAMTSSRPYRSSMPLSRVKTILCEGAGIQWDPAVIAAFFRHIDTIVAISHGSGTARPKPLEQT